MRRFNTSVLFILLLSYLFLAINEKVIGQDNSSIYYNYERIIDTIFEEVNKKNEYNSQELHSLKREFINTLNGMTIEMIEMYWRKNNDHFFVQKLFKIHNYLFKKQQIEVIRALHGNYDDIKQQWQQLCLICHISPMCYKYQNKLLSFFTIVFLKRQNWIINKKLSFFLFFLNEIKIYDAKDVIIEVMCNGRKQCFLNDDTIKLFCSAKIFETIFLHQAKSEYFKNEIKTLEKFGVIIDNIFIDSNISLNSIVKIKFSFPNAVFIAYKGNFIVFPESAESQNGH